MHKPITTLLLAVCALLPAYINAGQNLVCSKTSVAPTVDGLSVDIAWQSASNTTTPDETAPISHTLHCVYDKDRIYIKADFKDMTESRTHATSIWSSDDGWYKQLADREDTLLLKWNMDDNQGDLSLSSDTAYRADVWYWKAFRTDPVGYADDKSHIFSNLPMKKAKKYISKSGNRFFLVRRGDKGVSAYKPIIHVRHTGSDTEPSYEHREPAGSRADIKAKGHWQNNTWTVEFSRALDTGNPDDVRFKTNRKYQLGVSRYEIGGRSLNEPSNNPLHGTGEIDRTLTLLFEQ